jgi:tetratricopeptide (TPR) repeat protein
MIVALLFFSHCQTELGRQLKSPRMDYHNLGSVSIANKEYPKAVGFFVKSLQEDPNFPEGHLGLGTALYELGELEKAAEEFRLAGFPITVDILKQRKLAEEEVRE